MKSHIVFFIIVFIIFFTTASYKRIQPITGKPEPISRWSGTITYEEVINYSNAAFSGTCKRNIMASFVNTLPTMDREEPENPELNFTDDKGPGSHTYHCEITDITGRKCVTDCNSTSKAELHTVAIREWDNTYDIEVVSSECTGTVCAEEGGTKEYGPESLSVIVSDHSLGGSKDLLQGTETVTGELPAGFGTYTRTTTWHLTRAEEKVEPCTSCGSVIGIENQSLGQIISVSGTAFSLHYRSDRFHATDELGGWILGSHHQLIGNHLFLGNGKEQTLANDLNALAREIPGIVPAGGYLIASQDGTETYAFNNSGNHLRTFDGMTGALIYEFQYDAKNRLTSITDGFGLATTIERNTTGLPVAIIGPYGHRTDFTFDNSYNLASITNPAGEKTFFKYSSTGLLTSMMDPRGFTHTYEFDPAGRLIRDLDPAGGFTSLTRTSTTNSHTVAIGTALGRIAKYTVTNQAGGIRKRIVMFSDGLKNTGTTWPDGRRKIEFGDGTVATFTGNPDNRMGTETTLTVKLPSGLASTLVVQRSSTAANPSSHANLTGYNKIISINGRPFTIGYTSSNRTITFGLPSGRSILAIINTAGRVTEAQTGGLAPIRTTYDNNGRPVILEQGVAPNIRRYQLTYNSSGNLKSIIDPLGQMNSFLYDAAGRVIQTILPDGRILANEYDGMGNMMAFTSAGRATHNFEYDNTNRIIKYSPPKVGTGQFATLYKYNTDHQVTSIFHPDGQEIKLTYNPAGCVCGKISSLITPSGTTTFSYHSTNGKLTGINSPGGTNLALTYDGPLLTKETWSGKIAGSLSRHYNSDFQVTAHTVNDGPATTYVYDSDGLLAQSGDLVITRSPLNSLVSGTTLEAVKENWMYNIFGEITRSETLFKGSPLVMIEYTRDELGRIINKRESFGDVSNDYRYNYDKAGRLIAVTKNGVTNFSYTYDDNDNRLNVISTNGTTNGTYDDQDRIMSYGNTTYSFTDNGELLSQTAPSGTTTYKYDALGNLLQVNLPDSTYIEYIVDGHNRRIGKKVNQTIVQGFIYLDGLRIAAELDGSGKVVSRFVYGTQINVPDYMIKEGVRYKIVADHLGSPRLVVNIQTGAIVQQLDYDEFGNVITDTKPGFQPFGFAGGLYDNDTKLCQFGARDYDASIGRWTTKDPIRFKGMSNNLYQYVAGDPVNRIDPLGLQTSSPEYGEAVCSWNAAKAKGEKEVKALDTFRGTKGERYGMETEGGSEIDMRHYTAAYNTVQKLGGKGSYYAFWVSQLLGLGMEMSQCLNDSKSAFDPSDFLSNFKGALDAFQGNTPIAGSPSGPNGFLKF